MASEQQSANDRSGGAHWPQATEDGDALDLEEDVFGRDDPRDIARSLKQSAERSQRRRRRSPYSSAMSMLTFYINRAGDSLSDERRRTLEAAKDELRELFGRPRRNAPREDASRGSG